jgi:hypothetical protein
MKVEDLKKMLNNLPDDMEVIIQKDSEGNDFSPLAGAYSNAVYIGNNLSGDVYFTDHSADDACMDDDEWKQILNKPRSLILYPKL